MDLSDLNVLKQDTTNGAGFNESKSLSNLQQTPPPIPPRNNQIMSSNTAGFNTNAFGSMYSSNNGYFGSNPYSSYSNYGFNNYMTPFQSSTNNYGIGINNSSNSFLRAAEENSRSAFQSIESVVQAFSAVSAMFESTYYAVYNSFRAVVGVADQFYRLKTHLSGIISALAIFRAIKYLFRKLLRLLRLTRDAESGDAWSMAKQALSESEQFVKENYRKNQTNWPLLMFLAVVIGGPYLLWKVLSSIESLNKDDSLWMSGKIDHFIAVSEHDFDAVNVDELSFRKGQRITIAPKEYQPKLRGWLLASVDGKTPGIVPANYIKILGKKIGEKSKSEDKTNEIKTEIMSSN